MMEKPIVGQTLYGVYTGYNKKKLSEPPFELVVVKVGRKYFSCAKPELGENEWNWIKFMVEDWIHYNNGYTPEVRLYKSLEEYLTEEEKVKLCKYFGNAFQYGYNHLKLSIQQLRAIDIIIKAENR